MIQRWITAMMNVVGAVVDRDEDQQMHGSEIEQEDTSSTQLTTDQAMREHSALTFCLCG